MSSSYQEILKEMQDKFLELTGMNADDASDIGIRIKVLAGQLYSLECNADWLLNQMFPQTASGDYLDMHAEIKGLVRKSSIKASGTLLFSRNSPALSEIVIPAGTVCATNKVENVKFVTTKKAILPVGGISVSAPAEAQEGGAASNAAANSITVMITPPQGMEAVTNPLPFGGGSESEDDDAFRQRLLDSYRDISNSVNAPFYKNFAMEFEEVQYAAVLPRVRGKGTVDVVIYPRSGVNGAQLCSKIEGALNTEREIGVDVRVRLATLRTVSVDVRFEEKDGYDPLAVSGAIESALVKFSEALEIGEPLLSAAIGNTIYGVKGVYNYFIDHPSGDVEPLDDEIIRLLISSVESVR